MNLNDYPQLSAEEQKKLLLIYHNSNDDVTKKEAKDRLILSNLKMIYKEIHKLVDVKKISPDELFSFGVEGLCEAIEKFDINKGTNFSTYAFSYIRKYIRLGYKEVSGCEIPDWAWDARHLFFKVQKELREKLGREPSYEPCSIDTEGDFVSEIEEVLVFGKKPKMKAAAYKTLVEYVVNKTDAVSLDETVSDEEGSSRKLGELISDPKFFYQQEKHSVAFTLENYYEKIMREDSKEGKLIVEILKYKTQKYSTKEIEQITGLSNNAVKRLYKKGSDFLLSSKELREIAKSI